MTHTLQNDRLQIAVKTKGAELTSIQSIHDSLEYLWQGDASIWAGQAPILFPIVGGLKDNTYYFEGQKYTMPRHGFIRHNEHIELKHSSDTQLTFTLKSSPETKKMYPFEFEFDICYELIDNLIIVKHTVINTDIKSLYFSLGGHPAFKYPLFDNEYFEDYSVILKKAKINESFMLTTEGLIRNATIPIIKNNKIQISRTLFDHDALIFKNINAERATLQHKTKGPVVTMNFADFPDLGIWSKPAAPFICIEPWLGYADTENTHQRLVDKEGIQHLDPGKIAAYVYNIEIHLPQ